MEILHFESPISKPDNEPNMEVSANAQSHTYGIHKGLNIAVGNQELKDEIVRLKKQISEQNNTITQQQEELDKLESIKSRFFSVVSHDLKSPLCGLSGFINMILENIESFSQKEILQFMRQLKESIDGTIQLSDDLITWAQAQMKNFGLHPEIINPEEIIENVFEICKTSADKKGISLSYNIKDLGVLYGDKNQLTFIIRNLVSNAIKFTYNGGRIKVSISENALGDSVIRIQDNGVGITEEQINELFQPIQHKSTLGTSGEKGTGLGLMLVREFVEMHGGRIEAFSRKGEGSTFKITLNPLEVNQKILAI